MAENEIITQDGEIITSPDITEGSLAIGLARAEIDQQVATAHRFPRSIAKATKNILSLVTIDEQAAEECNYALPRGGKPITGPSIRLAEIVASQYGNCRVGARVVHIDRAEKYIEAEGIFLDLESNTATTARVRRRISDKHGRLLNDDMIIVTGNAACSIAKRNAILGGVPKAVWRKAHDAALATIKGDVKTLTERRDAALKAFAAFGVKPEQIFAALEIGGIEDITLETMPTLIGMHAALKSGEETVESMFGVGAAASAGGEKKGLKDKLGDIAEGKKPEPEQKQQKAEEKAAAPAENSAQNADDSFPGDDPSPRQDPDSGEIEHARDKGGEAYHNGMARKTIPAKFRAHPSLERAWLEGFDAEANAQEGGAE